MRTGNFRALYVPEDFNESQSGWCSLAQAVMSWHRQYKGLPVLLESVIPIIEVKEGKSFDAIESIRSNLERAMMDLDDIMGRYHGSLESVECDLSECKCKRMKR